ncbi:MAG: glycosyltransferase family A protein [Rhodobacter sp.]|nr:glycosyltransferase family A protein [Rhodobacter sp.]
MADIDVSVLVPTHNRLETLELSLKSILAQKGVAFEVLVAGDGCPREVAGIVDALGDDRIRFFDLPKAPGVGYANRNVALREAKGSLIAYASDDDLMTADHLANLAAHFRRDRVQWAYSRPLYVRPDGLILPVFTNLENPVMLRQYLREFTLIYMSAIMHRRSVFDDVGFWPEDVLRHGDVVFWRRILTKFGPGGVACERRASSFHFSADWRDDDDRWPVRLAMLRALAMTTARWPECLRLHDSGDASQQAELWARLSERPERSVRQLRHGIDLLQDRLAWNLSTMPAFR